MLINNMFTDFCGSEDLNNSFDLKKIKDELLRYKDNLDPKGKKVEVSNRGGYQSNDLNFKEIVKDYPNLKSLFDYTINTVKNLLEYDNVVIGNAWFNINKSGNHNTRHSHPGSIISGVIYIDVPKDIEGGQLVFHRERSFGEFQIGKFLSRDEYGSINYTIHPFTGLFVLFPSNIEHSVEQHFSESDRITVAINFPCEPPNK